MATKNFTAQAIDAKGEITFHSTVATRKAQVAQLQEVLQHCIDGKGVYVRTQTVGANTWAAFKYENRTLRRLFKNEAAEVVAKFTLYP